MLTLTAQGFEPITALSADRPIAHLVHVFPSFDIGGAQVRFAALVKAMGRRYAHTVLSLTGDFGAASLLAPTAPVSFLKPKGGGSPLRRLRAYRDQLRDLQPDLLLTYNWGAIEFAMANAGRTPHLHMEDGFGPDEAQRRLRRRGWTRRFVLARSEVVVPSETLQRIATRRWRFPARQVHYIANGIAPQRSHATDLVDLGLHLPANRPRIAWAGALRAEKNPLRLLRAFAPLRERATLIVIGDGPERGAVLDEADRLGLGDSLHLVGRRTDARDLIMQCDIAALSSNTEQMPLMVLEAMDAGLPIASVDVGDVRRMVAPENRHFVTPVSDGALGAALAELVARPTMRRAIGEANRLRARSVYTLPRMVEAHEALIEDAIAGSRCRTSPDG